MAFVGVSDPNLVPLVGETVNDQEKYVELSRLDFTFFQQTAENETTAAAFRMWLDNEIQKKVPQMFYTDICFILTYLQ